MRTLLHMPFDPASRAVRLALHEKGLPARLAEAPPWAEDGALAAANPARTAPVLIEDTDEGAPVCPASAILDYLEDAYPATPLLPSAAPARAEARRITQWMLTTFERDVIDAIIREQIDKRLMRAGGAEVERLREGRDALLWHLDYFEWILEARDWFAGDALTYADFAAAGALSTLDYLGAVIWEKFPATRQWYARVKSRPSMRPILRDRLSWLGPPRTYADPDF